MSSTDFGGAVKARLDAKGWTLERFAAAAGVSTSGLRKILRRQVAVVEPTTVNGLARALGSKPPEVRRLVDAWIAAAN